MLNSDHVHAAVYVAVDKPVALACVLVQRRQSANDIYVTFNQPVKVGLDVLSPCITHVGQLQHWMGVACM